MIGLPTVSSEQKHIYFLFLVTMKEVNKRTIIETVFFLIQSSVEYWNSYVFFFSFLAVESLTEFILLPAFRPGFSSRNDFFPDRIHCLPRTVIYKIITS